MAGAGDPRGAPPAAPAHRRRSPSAWPRWSPSTRFTDNLRDSVRGQARALLGADLALSSRRPLARPRRRCSTRSPRAAAPVARLTSFSGDGLRAAHQRHPPGAGGGRRGRLSVLRRDPDRARAAAWARAAAGPPRAWWTRRSSPPSTPAWATRSSLGEARFVISGTIVSAPGNVGVRAAFGPRDLHPRRAICRRRTCWASARGPSTRRTCGCRRPRRRRRSPTATGPRCGPSGCGVRTVARGPART